ncbi:MAG: hypothetical protein HDQ93_04305 [Desulfovibrio sp.]|nr:hypothetical protein [Desulfovibrio sp.]
MDINFVSSGENRDAPRQYLAVCSLRNFKGHKKVETHLFRGGWKPEEAKEIARLDLVSEDSPLPEELRDNISREATLECLLETFTIDEAREIADYLRERYADQIERLDICPIELPLPLGMTALGRIQPTETSGFIEFAKAKNYPLAFELRGYYMFPENFTDSKKE